MTKFMVLLCALLTGSTCVQSQDSAADKPKEALYPFRDKSGMYGYADGNLYIKIEPQYKRASLFNGQGFAVITDSLGKQGVIDQSGERILEREYDAIQLHSLKDFTLAEVDKSYYTRWRFWEWKFLPGFNLMGGGSDNRLIDTKVERFKKDLFILGDKPLKIRSERLTDKGIIEKNFNISTLPGSNRVLIDHRLYNIDLKGAHFLADGIFEQLTQNTFAQRKGQRLYIVGQNGKPLQGKEYTLVDSISFKVEDVLVRKPLSKDYAPIASAYRSAEGLIYIYPDFSNALPRLIHENRHPGDPLAAELIGSLWKLASVPKSNYFVFMSFHRGKSIFRFLDTKGNWHQSLPADISFTMTQRSGDILWPQKEYFVPQERIPEDWKINRISALTGDSLYHVTLRQDKALRQGIWDFERQEWLIPPEYYEIYPAGNRRYWRYRLNKGGLWGVMDEYGKIWIKPTYFSLHPDGWVSRQENGEIISFYLHLPTLKEYREK